ncbi:IS3 family transposase [Nocardia sp. CA-128927]|uniref:IS3 family transposase n=1 Tax=Nocardia sp. CA-128927 TaxID=3239975 RepID=UPI003D98B884
MGPRRTPPDSGGRGTRRAAVEPGRAGRVAPVTQAGQRAGERRQFPKKSERVLRGDAAEPARFELMAAQCAATEINGSTADITRMARLLSVSTSGFYAYLKRKTAPVLTDRQQRRADLTVKILAVHKDSDGTYGAPRITAELRDRGDRVSEKTVAAIMAEIGLAGISPRTFKVRTTIVDPTASFPDDLVQRLFDQGRVDAVWVSDITYLTCGEGDMYLCAIKDEHSKKVLGWTVADHMRTEMVTDAVDRAVAARGGSCAGTVLHSDRGSQYTANDMAAACDRHGLRRSMGSTGICWDNAERGKPVVDIQTRILLSTHLRHQSGTRCSS